MGLGLLGRGLGDTLFLIRCGARVTVTDLKTERELAPSLEQLRGLPVTLKLGRHDEADFINTDMVLRNADVPRTSPYLSVAREHGVPVEMDESLFAKHFKGTLVGITGTRGKTTTTLLVHKILSAHREGVYLGGNIRGMATLPLLERVTDNDVVVPELSSWQLQGFHDARISPSVSIFTNIYPDHLNRYTGMAEYIEDKKAVFRYQTPADVCFFNGDHEDTARLAAESPARTEFFRVSDVPADWRVPLPGRHNLANVAAAVRLTRYMGVPEAVIRSAIESFEGVEHRLEPLGEHNGILFVNDTTSTTPVAACAALDAMGDRPVLLIAGGADKKLDLSDFARKAAAQCRKIALLEGTATDALRAGIQAEGATDKIVGRFNGLRQAVHTLTEHAVKGDVILLSPGCASFGLFVNEFDRGDTFRQVVLDLQSGSVK